MLRTFTEAVVLDAVLAPMEGESAFDAALPTLRSNDEIIALAARLSASLPHKNRRRAFGTPTDDTQYLTAGSIVRLLSYDDVGAGVVEQWQSFHQLGIWRGIGARLAAFLAGDERAFADRVFIGDALRWVSFLAAVGPEALEGYADIFAARVPMPDEGLSSLKTFARVQRAKAAGDLTEMREGIKTLAANLGASETRNGRFYLTALDTLATPNPDLVRFLSEAEGNDYDTYGFLAPFFSIEPLLGKIDAPEASRVYLAIIEAALGGDRTKGLVAYGDLCSGTVPR